MRWQKKLQSIKERQFEQKLLKLELIYDAKIHLYMHVKIILWLFLLVFILYILESWETRVLNLK